VLDWTKRLRAIGSAIFMVSLLFVASIEIIIILAKGANVASTIKVNFDALIRLSYDYFDRLPPKN